MTTSAAKPWYVIRTKPHQEEIALLNLQNMSVEVYYPRLKERKVIRRKQREVIGPLFPGYLFGRFDLSTQYHSVKYARGVRNVVAFGGIPTPIDDTVIASIRAREQEEGIIVLHQPPLQPGEAVEILDGPFKGLVAIFERELSGQQRVQLLLDILATQARLVIERDKIRRVQP
ncbi:MAG: transcriptional activator RfaH [Nitrospinota bacterium]|nr:MAG: transcriptional activator RfaH [Nitrospinota bacterium]